VLNKKSPYLCCEILFQNNTPSLLFSKLRYAMQYQPQLEFLLHQARKAADIMRLRFRGEFQVYIKPDGSKVTDVDLEISKMWQADRAAAFPDSGLYSEESPDKTILPDKDYFVVDELDGTSYFVDGEHGFSHQAAYFVPDQGLVIGVLAYPLDDILLYAVRGEGVYLEQNGQTERIEPVQPKERNDLFFGHPARYKGEKYYDLLSGMGIPQHRILQTNAMRTLQMARRELDVNIFLMQKIEAWDWAGEKVIVEELGLNHSYLDGAPIHFGQPPRKDNPGYLLCPKEHLEWLMK
jgi:fructose-1,6-bisphosphatase/inositol monophosphatase family enzyme